MIKQIDLKKATEDYQRFLTKNHSIIISSLNEQGEPFISYAPFVLHDNKFYIYISKVSDHFKFIEQANQLNILLIEDEATTANIFARERITFQCQPKKLEKDDRTLYELFIAKHGAMMSMLRNLDFYYFELTPQSGRYVRGFGQAFQIDVVTQTLQHIVVDKNK